MKLKTNYDNKTKFLVGIDEVGRGPLAGPLTVCAFCLPVRSVSLREVREILRLAKSSKDINSVKREFLSKKIKKAYLGGQVNYAIYSVSASIIDKKGISEAIRIAVAGALKRLKINPRFCKVFLDGSLKAPSQYTHQRTIIRGDEKIKIISCASILAKVHRDGVMRRLDKKYPLYEFSKHKGYGTDLHIRKIKKYGACGIHRLSFLKKYSFPTAKPQGNK